MICLLRNKLNLLVVNIIDIILSWFYYR